MHIVYLIHFNQPYKRVRHYLGITNNLKKRIRRHKRGHGASLMRAVFAAGIEVQVFVLAEVATRNEASTLERKYKNRHNHKQLCPICKERHGEK